MKNKKLTLLAVMALILGLGLLMAGCESDSVAPNEDPPELTDGERAGQSAAMAAAASRILPQIVEFAPGLNKNEYTYNFDGQNAITGVVHFDFRTGGADGAPAAYDVADWGRMWTMADEPIVFEVGVGGEIEVEFDITASITQSIDTATLLDGSSGTFTGGAYSASFDFSGVVVTAGDDYPGGGTMTFVSGGTTLVVTFDGGNTAVVSLEGVDTWNIDLDDGSVTEIR